MLDSFLPLLQGIKPTYIEPRKVAWMFDIMNQLVRVPINAKRLLENAIWVPFLLEYMEQGSSTDKASALLWGLSNNEANARVIINSHFDVVTHTVETLNRMKDE